MCASTRSPGASFPHFSALRNGVARRRNVLVLFSSPPQRVVFGLSADSPFVSALRSLAPSPPAGRFLCRQRNRRKKPPKGTSSEHTSLTPFPQNRDTAKTPYRSVAPPLQIETHRFDLRRTFRRNLQAATKGSCAVFRRIRTRTPSPSARGLRPP